jgi:hypothetical protein
VLAQPVGTDAEGISLLELAGKTPGAENVVRISLPKEPEAVAMDAKS